jgi:hypothetical protein
MSTSTDLWAEFESHHEPPRLRMTVCGDGGKPWRLDVRWSLDLADASMWQYPISVTIEPIDGDEPWETIFDMSRQDARVLHGYLGLLLTLPDLRQEHGDVWDNSRGASTSTADGTLRK